MPVRTPLGAVVFIAGTVFAAGCSQMGQSTSPTAPTSTPSVAPSATSSSLAAAAAAPKQVPFKGTLQGTDTDSDGTSTTLVVTTDGSGNGTHLGRFSFTQRVTLTFATGTTTGSAHWFAANGDRIDTTVAGSGHPIAPGEFDITDVHTITGGTGRFAGAQGSFTVRRVASGITFTTSGTYDGSITSPGAAH
jgi:hypothetical protein